MIELAKIADPSGCAESVAPSADAVLALIHRLADLSDDEIHVTVKELGDGLEEIDDLRQDAARFIGIVKRRTN